jgi:hypothetical protein
MKALGLGENRNNEAFNANENFSNEAFNASLDCFIAVNNMWSMLISPNCTTTSKVFRFKYV